MRHYIVTLKVAKLASRQITDIQRWIGQILFPFNTSNIEGQNAFVVLCVGFPWQIIKTSVISLRVIESPNARDQIAFYASIHS